MTSTTSDQAITRPAEDHVRRRSPRPARANLFTLGVVASAYLVGYLSTLRTDPQFAPDSRYYAGMALWFGGTDKEAAAQKVAALSAKSGFASPPADQLFGWGLTQPRVVFPGLAMPFVKMFGISGLAVVSGIAMVLLVAVLAVMLGRRWGNVAAVGTLLLICASNYLMFYGTAMLTESLTALWCALLLLLAWRWARNPSTAVVIALIALTVVSGFTRQATLIPAGAFFMAWLGGALLRQRPNSWGVPALVVGVTAVGVQLLQLWWFPGFSQVQHFEGVTGTDNLGDALRAAPELAWHILRVDVYRMARWDNALFVLLVLAVISMAVFWRRSESHLLLGSLLAYELYNVTNGVPTTFRYGMPGLVFVASSVAMLLAEVESRPRAHEPESEPAAAPV